MKSLGYAVIRFAEQIGLESPLEWVSVIDGPQVQWHALGAATLKALSPIYKQGRSQKFVFGNR